MRHHLPHGGSRRPYQKLAPDLVPDLEILRAESELARRQQAELLARERYQVASAELHRLLRLDPAAQAGAAGSYRNCGST